MSRKGSTSIKGSTSQQKLFAYAYFNNKGNGTQAAIAAGYSKKSAKEQASRLLTYANVQKILISLNQDIEEKAIITKEQVLQEYKRIALFDLRTLYDENGVLKPIDQLSDAAGAAITGIEVLEEFEGTGEERVHIGNTVKVKLHGKIAALDAIRDTMGWRAPTKVASTDKDGNDQAPLSDDQVEKIISSLHGKKP